MIETHTHTLPITFYQSQKNPLHCSVTFFWCVQHTPVWPLSRARNVNPPGLTPLSNPKRRTTTAIKVSSYFELSSPGQPEKSVLLKKWNPLVLEFFDFFRNFQAKFFWTNHSTLFPAGKLHGWSCSDLFKWCSPGPSRHGFSTHKGKTKSLTTWWPVANWLQPPAWIHLLLGVAGSVHTRETEISNASKITAKSARSQDHTRLLILPSLETEVSIWKRLNLNVGESRLS